MSKESEEIKIEVCPFAPNGYSSLKCKQHKECYTCDEEPDKTYCGNYRIIRKEQPWLELLVRK
jgi:hypothetical protein